MHEYFKPKNKPINNDERNYYRLDFDKLQSEMPNLTDRVFLLRSRVRELKNNFESDAIRTRNIFIAVTAATIICVAVILISGLHYAERHETSQTISSIVVLVGAFSALAAAAPNSFGLHKRYSAMFSAYWAMKALDTNIDVIVFDIARGAQSKTALSEVELSRLRSYLNDWLIIFNTSLLSFGDKYGSALAALTTSPIKQADK